MKKKIRDLTDEELFKAIYTNDEDYSLVSYKKRDPWPENDDEPAINISWDNCRFCKLHETDCGCNCKMKNIDFDEIRNSIYANDEVYVDEEEN